MNDELDYELGMDDEIQPGPERFDAFKRKILANFDLTEKEAVRITHWAESEMAHRVNWHRERRKGTYAWARANSSRLKAILSRKARVIEEQGLLLEQRKEIIDSYEETNAAAQWLIGVLRLKLQQADEGNEAYGNDYPAYRKYNERMEETHRLMFIAKGGTEEEWEKLLQFMNRE